MEERPLLWKWKKSRRFYHAWIIAVHAAIDSFLHRDPAYFRFSIGASVIEESAFVFFFPLVLHHSFRSFTFRSFVIEEKLYDHTSLTFITNPMNISSPLFRVNWITPNVVKQMRLRSTVIRAGNGSNLKNEALCNVSRHCSCCKYYIIDYMNARLSKFLLYIAVTGITSSGAII